jgi:hypothetical protein
VVHLSFVITLLGVSAKHASAIEYEDGVTIGLLGAIESFDYIAAVKSCDKRP